MKEVGRLEQERLQLHRLEGHLEKALLETVPLQYEQTMDLAIIKIRSEVRERIQNIRHQIKQLREEPRVKQ